MNLLPRTHERLPHCYFRRGLDTRAGDAHTLIPGPALANALAETAGIIDMRHFSSLLRSTRAEIGRRLAQIVAIAAASLPAAGA